MMLLSQTLMQIYPGFGAFGKTFGSCHRKQTMIKANATKELINKINKIVYAPIQSLGGSVSAEHGIGLDKKEYLSLCKSKEEIEMMKRLKKTLDPNNILNPGRIF